MSLKSNSSVLFGKHSFKWKVSDEDPDNAKRKKVKAGAFNGIQELSRDNVFLVWIQSKEEKIRIQDNQYFYLKCSMFHKRWDNQVIDYFALKTLGVYESSDISVTITKV